MDSRDQLIDLLKDRYQYELSRRNRFDDIMSLPVTVLTLIFAGIFYVISEVYSIELSCIYKAFFTAAIGIMLLLSFFAILALVYVFFGYKREYCTFPESKLMIERYKELQSYFEGERRSKRDILIAEEFKNYTIKWYFECNNHNMITNDRRAAALHTFKMLLSGIIFLGLILMFFVFILKIT